MGGPHTHYTSKMADGRHLGKIEYVLYLSRGLSDFDDIWHADAIRPSWPFRPLKIWNFKNPRWRSVRQYIYSLTKCGLLNFCWIVVELDTDSVLLLVKLFRIVIWVGHDFLCREHIWLSAKKQLRSVRSALSFFKIILFFESKPKLF